VGREREIEELKKSLFELLFKLRSNAYFLRGRYALYRGLKEEAKSRNGKGEKVCV
jgi:hypothetical protein